jgi:hypothetical protein
MTLLANSLEKRFGERRVPIQYDSPAIPDNARFALSDFYHAESNACPAILFCGVTGFGARPDGGGSQPQFRRLATALRVDCPHRVKSRCPDSGPDQPSHWLRHDAVAQQHHRCWDQRGHTGICHNRRASCTGFPLFTLGRRPRRSFSFGRRPKGIYRHR